MSALYALCAVTMTVAVCYLAFVKQSDAQANATNQAAIMGLMRLEEVKMAEDVYRNTTGKYGWKHEIFPYNSSSALSPERLETSLHVDVEAAVDGQAYFAVADYSKEGGVECAALARNGDETSVTRLLRTGTWRLEANSMGECRKTGWPFSWLHWAGLGYVDVGQAIRSMSRYGS